MRRRTPQKAIGFALFIAAISFYNFSRIKGGECIRAVHIVTLLVCGAAIGVALTNLIMLMRNKTED
ncbi:MAG: hypothetical protein ABIY51_05095 [Ferruginibacter sp.]